MVLWAQRGVHMKKNYGELVDYIKGLNWFSVLLLKITYQILVVFLTTITLLYAVADRGFIVTSQMIDGLWELIPAVGLIGVIVALAGDLIVAEHSKKN